MLRINDVTQIWLGIQGENLAREIEIDVSDWVEDFPDAGFSVWMTAPGGTVPQATGASYDAENQKIVWSPSSTDTYVAGEGEAEIRLSEGNVVKKTKKIRIGISGSVTSGGSTLGADWQEYIDEADRIRALAVAAQLAAEQAQDAAENVAEHPPYINLGTYRWMVWNRTAGAYEDSGISAQGVPGPAGSQGPQGIQGERGPQGIQGIQGIQGPVGPAGQQGQAGPAGERGEAFKITKTYSSIAAMEADYSSTDVDYEDFVIIQTVQGQADNGKVYKKGTAAWEFIVQMAGVEGPAGPTGPQGPQGIQGIQGERGETGSQGPQGIQGVQGDPGPGVPAGGTAGQYLRKNSGTDYDTDWESPVNGLTETEAGKVLDARQGKALDDRATAIQDGLAIVANGDTHAAIASGKFVYVKNHASLAEGLYKATAAIGTNAALTTSNLTADGSGGLNDLQGQVTTLNTNKANVANLSYGSYTYTSQAAMETGLVNLATTLGVQKTTAIYLYPNFGSTMFGGAPGVATIETGSSVAYFSVLFHNYVGVFYGKYLNGTWTWESLAFDSNITLLKSDIALLDFSGTAATIVNLPVSANKFVLITIMLYDTEGNIINAISAPPIYFRNLTTKIYGESSDQWGSFLLSSDYTQATMNRTSSNTSKIRVIGVLRKES